MSRVYAISLGDCKGAPKQPVDRATLRKGHGVEGDCHAGSGNRQVSILAWEDVVALRKEGITAAPGNFCENIMTEGLNFSEIAVGARLRIGSALLEVTGIGKPEWKDGDYSFRGVPLVARCGLFAEVVESGAIKAGDAVRLE